MLDERIARTVISSLASVAQTGVAFVAHATRLVRDATRRPTVANLSSLTRRDQVFAYLKGRIGEWVDGTALANEQVGGSEGLKRLRELRHELEPQGVYEIQMRQHPDPDRDIFQYRLMPVMPMEWEPKPPAAPPTPAPPPKPKDHFSAGVKWDDETGQYLAIVSDETLAKLAGGQTDLGVPVAGEHMFSKMPTKLGLGYTIPCPRCHNVHLAIRKIDPVTGKKMLGDKNIIGYEKLTHDPHKPSQICPRCNGFGVVPPTDV